MIHKNTHTTYITHIIYIHNSYNLHNSRFKVFVTDKKCSHKFVLYIQKW